MNVFSFTGNLGKDAETSEIGSSTLTEFNVAVKSGYGDKAITTWVRCNFWGDRGEAVAPYLNKGVQVGIVGELTNRPYTTKEGVEKYSLEVRVNDLTLLGKKDSSDSSNVHDTRTANKPEQPAKPSPGGNNFDDFEDDIPF
jgi:single-strand DNA-binding protein